MRCWLTFRPREAGDRLLPALPLTRDHVVWAYRLLLDRDPESEDVITPKLHAWATTRELRTDLMSSEEFRLKNPDHAHTAQSTIVFKPLAPGVRLAVDLSDHVIGLNILRDRYERDEVAFAVGQLRPGDVALDVGAHIGFFTLQMAQAVGPQGAVYAFEPLDRNADLLEQSVRENQFDRRVIVERAAVAERGGTRRLRFARETLNSGGAFLSDAEVPGLAGLAAVDVRTIRLDDYPCRRPVRLIKMDVEGAEPQVIAGARGLLAADRPVIVTELHAEQLARVSQTTPQALLGELARLGYRAYHIDGGRLGAAVGGTLEGVHTVACLHEAAGR
jgi:FkbM family methyltransferase